MKRLLPIALGVVLAALAGCGSTPSSAPTSASQKDRMENLCRATINDLRNTDPGMDRFFNGAYGYAVFPDVTAAAVVIGGAHGNGCVFRDGKIVGWADVSKANVGASLGGQSYSEVVFFESESSFARFTGGTLQLDARASAVAASAGAATAANYENGVAVFTHTQGGLMVQAAVGGQKFRFIPSQMGTASEK